MRLATFNVENIFERPKVMNLDSWRDGRQVLEDFQQLSVLIQKERYLENDREEMLKIMRRNNNLLSGQSKYIRLRTIRGKLVKKKLNSPPEIAAHRRDDWIGWFELIREPIEETAIENTARIINEIRANVLCVVEADSHEALKNFNYSVLPKIGGQEYDHVRVINGNDDRGLHIGIMTDQGYDIKSIISHVNDVDSDGRQIFTRDCPEFKIITPLGNSVLIMINHFKSKGYGKPAESDGVRKRQAKRVREIYEERVNEGYEFIAIVGDFNDSPDNDPLKPLLADDSNLTDIMVHNKFVSDGRPGTFLNGNYSDKLDYILMSPKLSTKVQNGGIERRGVWAGKNGTSFPHLPEIKQLEDAASDHAALWVDFHL